MKFKKEKLEKLIFSMETITETAKKYEDYYSSEIEKVHPEYKKSALNLIHYLALRKEDIRELQKSLGELGISRLGRAESHVMASVLAVKNLLRRLVENVKLEPEKPQISFKSGKKVLKKNTTALLGKKLKGSSIRIMVTLPTEAASDPNLVFDLVSGGMNCARINCAHDGPEIWKKMIDNIKKAKKKTGRNCKICMDLGGPKLRTGAMVPGPEVLHLRPKRDNLGKVTAPALVWLSPIDKQPENQKGYFIPIPKKMVTEVKENDKIVFRDTRDKKRQLIVTETKKNGFWAECYQSAYLVPGTVLKLNQDDQVMKFKVGNLPVLEEIIYLKVGDTLLLHTYDSPGEPAKMDDTKKITKPAHISCTLPEVFADVKVGEPILLDDGKMEGEIKEVSADEMLVEITYTKGEAAKLRADKGINLPESNLKVRGLTAKDKKDLEFVVKHADVVNMSFVNSADDVIDLVEALARLQAADLGIILKIETQKGFNNLPAVLLTAMRNHPIGVMIARGDLALEVGWKHLAQIQEEILWLCEAAHIPIVWATQVLETLSKKGRPSRAEITDAAMSERAECVMLNKGPHIIATIKILDEILKSMQDYHHKKAPMLPPLKVFDPGKLDDQSHT
jgi:pyruvate kinase